MSANTRMGRMFWVVAVALGLSAGGCGDDDGNEALRSGVGDACMSSDDCMFNDQECLTEFKGGYCGRSDCQSDLDCPQGSACVTEQGVNYCFLLCVDKPDCNWRRAPEDESNCSGSAEFVDDTLNRKACIPPSGS